MNGKKAKLLRKAGNSTTKGKRLYKSLPRTSREVASKILTLRAENPVDQVQPAQPDLHQSGFNRKSRQIIASRAKELLRQKRANPTEEFSRLRKSEQAQICIEEAANEMRGQVVTALRQMQKEYDEKKVETETDSEPSEGVE
jgi:hypothetical protein